MQISSKHPNPEERTRIAKEWLLPILSNPNLDGSRNIPSCLMLPLYVNGEIRLLKGGYWQMDSVYIFLPLPSTNMHKLDKLSVLSAIAGAVGLTNDPAIQEKLIYRLTDIMKETSLTIYGNLVEATHHVSRLAIHPETCQVAAEVGGKWLTPSGAPMEVADSWIIMDF